MVHYVVYDSGPLPHPPRPLFAPLCPGTLGIICSCEHLVLQQFAPGVLHHSSNVGREVTHSYHTSGWPSLAVLIVHNILHAVIYPLNNCVNASGKLT